MRGVRVNLSRFLLTGLAVAVGTAFLATALTLHGHFATTLRQSASADALYDVYVLGQENESDGKREQVPTRLLSSVEQAPNVASATALWESQGALYHLDGSVIATGGVPVVYSPTPDGQGWPMWKEGRPPASAGEVALEETGAQRARLHASDRIQVAYGTGLEDAVVTGVYELEVGTPDLVSIGLSPGAANSWARELGDVDAFGVTLKKGVNAEPGVAALQDTLGSQADVLTRSQYSTYLEQSVSEQTRVGSILLVTFFAFALLLSAFIISNTFRLATSESADEYASLRMAGATGSQVFGIVAAQAAGVGLVGSAVGVGLGVLAVKGVGAVVALLGSSLSGALAGVGASPSALVTAFIIGVLVTLASAVPAAQRASHGSVSADATRVEGGAAPKFRGRTAASIGLVASGVTGLVLGAVRLPSSPSVFLVSGILLLSTGVVLASPMLLRGLAKRWSARLTLGTGKGRVPLLLALKDVEDYPRRSAAGAAVLIVGVGLVVGGATLTQSYAKSFAAATKAHVETDLVAAPTSPLSSLPTGVKQILQTTPGVASVEDQVGFTTLTVSGEGTRLESTRALLTDPSYLDSTLTFTLVEGEYPEGGGQVALSPTLMDTLGAHLGDQLLVKGDDSDFEVKVVGEVEDLPEGASLLGSPELAAYSTGSTRFPALAFVTINEGVSAQQVTTSLKELVSALPGVQVESYTDLVGAGSEVADEVVAILHVGLVLTLAVTLITLASTMSLTASGRKPEFGLLADLGMSESSIEGAVLTSALVTSAYGTVLGVGLGLGLRWVTQLFLSGSGVHLFAFPWMSVVAALVLAPLAAVVAAWAPAHRASKPQRPDEVLVA